MVNVLRALEFLCHALPLTDGVSQTKWRQLKRQVMRAGNTDREELLCAFNTARRLQRKLNTLHEDLMERGRATVAVDNQLALLKPVYDHLEVRLRAC